MDKLIDRFGLSDAKAAITEDTIAVFSDETKLRSLVGGPLYIAVYTWLQSECSYRCMLGSSEARGSLFESIKILELTGYTDADWAGNVSTRKSTTGYAICVTLCSMESEYVDLSEAMEELVCLRGLMKEMGDCGDGPVTMMEDNQSCISFVNFERINRRSKHIETKEHFFKQLCDQVLLKLE